MKTFGASDQRSESGQRDRIDELSTKDLARFLRLLILGPVATISVLERARDVRIAA